MITHVHVIYIYIYIYIFSFAVFTGRVRNASCLIMEYTVLGL